MQGEDTYVLTVSDEEAEVIKQFVSAMERVTIGVDNDDIWDIMETIANKRTSGSVTGIMIMYKESEE
jgi:hypothetical protein|nr:MAG TPA: hypothetical protein [Bacteriophage sp.]DAZ73123.1 MAG TPA: hypothetical protein [Caudoviricetes sp.]